MLRNSDEGIPVKKLAEDFRVPFVRVFFTLWKNKFYLANNPDMCVDSASYEEAKKILQKNLRVG